MAARACASRARVAIEGWGKPARTNTRATGYVCTRATSERPGATCARTPRWLISSQISLLDCGAARWSMPATPSPHPFLPSLSVTLPSPPLPPIRAAFSLANSSPLCRARFDRLVASLSRLWPLWNGTMRPPAPPPHADVPRGHTRGARNIIVTQLSIVSGVKWRREPRILLMIVVPALRNLNRTGLDSSRPFVSPSSSSFLFFLSLDILYFFFLFPLFFFFSFLWREWKLAEEESCNLNIRRRLTC